MRVFLVDVAAIVLFAALGRRNHGEGTAAAGVLVVAAPFLAGWTVAWFATRLNRVPASADRALLALAVALPIGLCSAPPPDAATRPPSSSSRPSSSA